MSNGPIINDDISDDTLIGIDLGTTNSEVAIVRDGRVEVLDVSPGTKLLPSYVGLGDDGALLIGESARNQYALYPERTIRSVKRRMGEEATLALGDSEYRPQEISAMLLKRLKGIAEARLGAPVARAVITVPAFFSDAQRQATREAGELAGLDVARIINEPTAAALAYESGERASKRILVYDLGGGTFDVSVVDMNEGVVEVLASHGDNHLGGDDFDARIVEHVVAHTVERHGIDPNTSAQAMARITRAAETAKIALSSEPFARLEEEYLLQVDGAPVNLSLELSREDYEAMIDGYIERTLAAVHTALDGAGLAVAELDEVLLVGGATRTPLVGRRLEETLGLQPRMDIDPELCVAAGAAIQAAAIGGQDNATVLVDVTPYTFGTSALGELHGEEYPFRFVPVIRKNTPIPVSRTELFYTVYDHQEKVEVGVYQGEDPDALNNVEIGKYLIEGLSRVPAGNPVTSTFSLDLDGILHVTSREKSTGLEKSITIEGAMARIDEDGLGEARSRIDALFGDADAVPAIGGRPDPAVPADASSSDGTSMRDGERERTGANALLEKAERLLKDASEEDREDLVDAMETLRDALAGDASAPLAPSVATLADLVYYLDAG